MDVRVQCGCQWRAFPGKQPEQHFTAWPGFVPNLDNSCNITSFITNIFKDGVDFKDSQGITGDGSLRPSGGEGSSIPSGACGTIQYWVDQDAPQLSPLEKDTKLGTPELPFFGRTRSL